MRKPVRVLVVDDSAVMRKLIPQLLQGDPFIEVVGTAMDGLLGLKKIGELHPDVVTLDLEMPRMDGLEMLREIVREYRVPVIVVSAHNEKGAYSALLEKLPMAGFQWLFALLNAVGSNGSCFRSLARLKVLRLLPIQRMKRQLERGKVSFQKQALAEQFEQRERALRVVRVDRER